MTESVSLDLGDVDPITDPAGYAAAVEKSEREFDELDKRQAEAGGEPE